MATGLLDITKAFESVVHQVLWDAAQEFAFDLTLLSWPLLVFRMRRCVVYQGGLSRFVQASISIVPGDCNADALMGLALMPAVRRIQASAGRALITRVMDDVQVTVHGPSTSAMSREAASIFERCIDEIQGRQRLPVHQGKLVLLANSAARKRPFWRGRWERRAGQRGSQPRRRLGRRPVSQEEHHPSCQVD